MNGLWRKSPGALGLCGWVGRVPAQRPPERTFLFNAGSRELGGGGGFWGAISRDFPALPSSVFTRAAPVDLIL